MCPYRIIPGVGVYFVTFSVVDWIPVLTDAQPFNILIDSLRYCIAHKGLCVNAYVIMPTHLHAVVFDGHGDPQNLHQTLTQFRKFTGRRLSDWVEACGTPALAEHVRIQTANDRNHQFWQTGWHPEGINGETFWRQKVNYLHENPCRKGWVQTPQEWRFSSAAYWLDGTPVDLPIAEIDWD
jgi:REP element-mobilizing transposase RayT